jgi:benzoyl-CoA reductase/2-hydroxyglutaryl-CoA dehydratase subunit BcrC/BadD/HgdB
MDNKLPKDFESFSDARRQGFLRAKEIKDRGEKMVGIYCTYTPKEVIYAAGAYPVSLCATNDETIPAAEKHLPKNLCPLIKASYGFAITDKCPYMYFSDLVVGETTCDGKKKMYELLGEIKDTHIMNLPHTKNDLALEFWKKEIEILIKKLEEKFGVEITEEKLRESIKLCNEERKILKEFYSLGKLVPPPIAGYDIYKVLDGANFTFDKKEQNEKVKSMIEELKETYRKNECKISKTAPRILVTGCPIGGVYEKIVKPLEELGAVVVAFENCSGVKNLEELVREDIDPIDALAQKYLNILCSIMSPNKGREELLDELIEEYKVDGVVEIVLQSCHTYAVETHKIRRLVSKNKELPYIALETDYSKSDFGQIKIRMEAFLELIG